MKELYEYAIAHNIPLPAREPATQHKDSIFTRNTIGRIVDSLQRRGVRQTLAAVGQYVKRRVRSSRSHVVDYAKKK